MRVVVFRCRRRPLTSPQAPVGPVNFDKQIRIELWISAEQMIT